MPRFFRYVIIVLLLILFLTTHNPQPTTINASYTPAPTITENMNVSARIMARLSDIQFGFTSDLKESSVGADSMIGYTITYGSYLDYRTPMEITAEWSMGSVKADYLASYNIIAYVPGSATNDYWGESTPVVDTVRRKITWKVKSFPNNTIDKKLYFKLKTPDFYVTDQPVSFTVKVRLKTDEIELPEISLDQMYNPTQFIKEQVKGLHLLSADIRIITDTSFAINILTSIPTRITVYFGTDPDNLDQTIGDNSLKDQRLITIDKLKPNTKYYFKILIENDHGIQKKTRELLTVTTAAVSLLSQVDLDKLLISSEGISLLRGYGLGDKSAFIVPVSTTIEVFLPFVKAPPSLVFLSVGDQRVMGLSTDINFPSPQKIRLLETQRGLFTGKLNIPDRSGRYDLMIEAENTSGGINQDVLTSMIVSEPLRIYDEYNKPVENAIIYIERYNSVTKKFEYYPAESYGSRNPLYSGPEGVANIVLPEGEYTINVNALGFKTNQGKYFLSAVTGRDYPKIQMVAAPFSLISYFRYYYETLIDSVDFGHNSLSTLAHSGRFLDLSLLVSLAFFSVLSLLLNIHRLKLSLEGLLIYIHKKIDRILGKKKGTGLFVGFIEEDGNGLPVHAATVFLMVKKNHVIADKDITNALGEFRVRMEPAVEYEILVKKNGFLSLRDTVGMDELLNNHPPFIMKKETVLRLPVWLDFMIILVKTLVHGLSDTILIGVIILDLVLIYRVGPVKVLPMAIVTVLNLLLWIDYEWGRYQKLT